MDELRILENNLPGVSGLLTILYIILTKLQIQKDTTLEKRVDGLENRMKELESNSKQQSENIVKLLVKNNMI